MFTHSNNKWTSFREPSVHSPFSRHFGFSLISSPSLGTPLPHKTQDFNFFSHCNCLVFNSAQSIAPRLEAQPDCGCVCGGVGHPGTVWGIAGKILGRERRRFGELGCGTGRKGTSRKVVCAATIKSKKLKMFSVFERRWLNLAVFCCGSATARSSTANLPCIVK